MLPHEIADAAAVASRRPVVLALVLAACVALAWLALGFLTPAGGPAPSSIGLPE